jgi:hypothetical protein
MKEKIHSDLKRFIQKQTSLRPADYAGDIGGLRLRKRAIGSEPGSADSAVV